jgi:hypothetical protein
MSEWYYTSAGQQVGPVTAAQLKQAAQSGQLTPTDLVWKDGMPDWTSATKLKGIFDPTTPEPALTAAGPQPGGPAAQRAPQPHYTPPQYPAVVTQASQIAYYNPTAGLGARLASTMKGFPTPTGPQDQWPLADVHLGQLAVAESHRKHIRALASLFNLFFVLGVIGSFLLSIAVVIMLAFSPRSARGLGDPMFIVNAGISIGTTILYYFAARETRRCRAWPAILFTILFGLAILFVFGSVFFATTITVRGPGSGAGMLGAGMIGAVLVCVIPFAFLWMCIKAMTAIPRFLACPVWAQEALVAAKL